MENDPLFLWLSLGFAITALVLGLSLLIGRRYTTKWAQTDVPEITKSRQLALLIFAYVGLTFAIMAIASCIVYWCSNNTWRTITWTAFWVFIGLFGVAWSVFMWARNSLWRHYFPNSRTLFENLADIEDFNTLPDEYRGQLIMDLNKRSQIINYLGMTSGLLLFLAGVSLMLASSTYF